MSFDAPPRTRPTGKAFSLVEIMIVIVIIGMLAGVVSINVRSYLIKAKQNTARQELAVIVKGLETFYGAYGRYPTNEEGLESLAKPSEKFPENILSGDFTDPWNNRYEYNCPGARGPYEVLCLGADGAEGGSGAEADITSDDLKE